MQPKAKSIDELQLDILRVYNDYQRTGTNPWTHLTALIDLQYQVGTLAKRVLQLQGDRFDEGKTNGQLRAAIADELADILAEILFLAHALDLDLMKAWNNMLESDATKIAERMNFRRKRAS